jgi:stringent starvation protein B
MLALLERAEARVHLDARREGVRLPARLMTSGTVRLDYGYGLKPPITDLTIDDDGIGATLSFDDGMAFTFVPWPAVFLIADFDGRGAVWQEDIPTDLFEVDVEHAEGAPSEPAGAPTAAPAAAPGKKPRPSYLKLVK